MCAGARGDDGQAAAWPNNDTGGGGGHHSHLRRPSGTCHAGSHAWLGRSAPGGGGRSRGGRVGVHAAIDINGDYLPVAGDFDGDGRDDIAWYGPGGTPESMWWGRAGGGVTPGALVRV